MKLKALKPYICGWDTSKSFKEGEIKEVNDEFAKYLLKNFPDRFEVVKSRRKEKEEIRK